MDMMKIDVKNVAFKMIEVLYQMGEINHTTYSNILQHKNLYISQIEKNEV